MPKHQGRRFWIIAIISSFILMGPIAVFAYPFSGARSIAVNAQPNDIVIADFNGDGVNDMAVPNYSANTVSILLGIAGGTFNAPTTFATGAGPSALTVANFDGRDGLDLAVAIRGANRVTYFPGGGDGTFGAGTDYAVGSQPYSMINVDLDQDGNIDVVVANINADTVSVLMGNGDGTFDASVPYATGMDPVGLVAKDFDNDGYPDIAVANSCAGCFLPYSTEKVSVLINRQDGTFNAKVDYDATCGLTGVESADLNGDAYQDLIVSRRNSNNVGVFLNEGRGTFGAMTTFNTGIQPQGIIAADFNRDSKVDSAVANGGTNTLSILLGNGDGTFAVQATAIVETQPRILAYADMNGDGNSDLLSTHYSLGTVNILFDADPPAITTLSPSSGVQGTTIPVVITGNGFSPTDVVKKNGASLATTFVNTTRLQVNLSTFDTASPATLSLTVYDPTRNVSSTAMAFTVTPAPPPQGAPPPIDLLDAPKGPFSIEVNGGAVKVGSRDLELSLSAGSNVARMAISRFPDFSDAAQIPYVTAKKWDLCSSQDGTIHAATCPAGEYTLYAEFFTKYGQPSPAVSSKISFGTSISALPAVTTPGQASASQPLTSVTYVFRRTLRLGSVGEDVRSLQKYLNSYGLTVAVSGPGSVGNETAYYGQATMSAVKKFQEAHAFEILAPLGMISGTGVFGPATMAYVNAH